MKQEYFELGQIVNHFGIKGMVKVNPFTDDISQFEELESILVEKNGKLLDIQIEEVKYSKNQILLKLILLLNELLFFLVLNQFV